MNSMEIMLKTLIIVVASVKFVQSAEELTMTCSKDGDDRKVTFTYPVGTNEHFLRMYIHGDENTTDCVDVHKTVPSSMTLTIVVNEASPTCSNAKLTGGSQVLANGSITVLITSHPALLQTSDVYFRSKMCDFNDAGTSTKTVKGTPISVSGLPSTEGSSQFQASASVSLSLYDPVAEADVDKCQLGDNKGLKMKLKLAISKVTKGVRPTECYALYDDPANDPTAEDKKVALMLDSCFVGGLAGLPRNSDNAFLMKKGFKKDDTLSDETSFVALSEPSLYCFQFSKHQSIFIQCTVEYCATVDDIACAGDLNATNKTADDTCDNKPSPSRRRRDTEEKKPPQTVVMEIKVSEGDELSGTADQDDTRSGADCSTSALFRSTTFLAVISVLGGVLLLMVVIALYLAVQLQRKTRKREQS